MKRFPYILTMFLSILFLILSGCSDDIQLRPDRYDYDNPDGIVLRVPDERTLSQSMTRGDVTRAEVDILEKEGTINSLWFLAFKGEGKVEADIIRKDLTAAVGEDLLLDNHPDGFKDYDLTTIFKNDDNSIKEGAWRIYVVANLDKYTTASAINDIDSEDTLKDLQLIFNDANGNRLTQEKILGSGDNTGNGLPMACLPSAIQFKASGSSDFSGLDTGSLTIEKSTKGTLHADLTFLCSKVRYTVFFDNTVENSSTKSIFNGISFNVNSVDAKDIVYNGSSVSGTCTSDGDPYTIKNLKIDECVYGDLDPSTYPSSSADNDQRFVPLPVKGNRVPDNKRVFQGVVYMPENLATSDDARTSFVFNCQTEYLDGGEKKTGTPLTYKMPLLPSYSVSGTAQPRTIQRGHAYDIVASVTSVSELDVKLVQIKQWTKERLVYSLQLPTYLNVSDTQVEVRAGQISEMTYESNAMVTPESPKINDKNIFIIVPTEGKITVRVNPLLTETEMNTVSSNKEQYNFFHLTAGNIRKKIEVTPLELGKYLLVNPKVITIDAREKFVSGEYDGKYEIMIETTLSSFTIKDVKVTSSDDKTSWVNAKPGDALTLTISDDDGTDNSGNKKLVFSDSKTEYNFTTSTATKNDNQMTLILDFDGINAGGDFWGSERTLKFKVCSSDPTVEDEEVIVYIKPNTDDYIIYFKSPSEWGSVHIYVYQCLELPSAWEEGYSIAKSDWSKYASKPVGFQNKTDENVYYASLAYSFTGAVSFKGWDADINKNELKNMSGGFHYGFYVFTNGKEESNWNPSHPVADADSRYYKDVDFCADHRKDIAACSLCKDGKLIESSWPGVCMVKERLSDGADWWKFKLTSVATPGKTLIIFTNTTLTDNNTKHAGDHTKRYPKQDKVGLALFDFPDRIGYFNYEYGEETYNPSFMPMITKAEKAPDKTIENGYINYRIKWNYTWGTDGNNPNKYVTFDDIPTTITLYKDDGTAIEEGTKYTYDEVFGSNNYFFHFKIKESQVNDGVTLKYTISNDKTTGNTPKGQETWNIKDYSVEDNRRTRQSDVW